MLYRIHTESTGRYRQTAIDIMATTFDGFTVIDATGYWKGTREESIILEVYAADDARAQVYAVAEEIRRANAQQAVIVSESDTALTTIDGG